MAHYDDIIEAREEREYKERADKLGLSTKALRRKEEHDLKMMAGFQLLNRRNKEQSSIDYFKSFSVKEKNEWLSKTFSPSHNYPKFTS